MFRLKEINANGVAVLDASGKYTKKDNQRVFPELEAALEDHGKLHFYMEIGDLSGAEFGALKEDLLFDIKHKDRYGRIAVVGERSWQEWATKLSDFFFDAPVRFYEKAEANDAWNWVNGQ